MSTGSALGSLREVGAASFADLAVMQPSQRRADRVTVRASTVHVVLQSGHVTTFNPPLVPTASRASATLAVANWRVDTMGMPYVCAFFALPEVESLS